MSGPDEPETTEQLLARARAGDEAARSQLFASVLPRLRRWAHGRLPLGARAYRDTEDLVQSAMLKALDHLQEFEPRHEDAFLAYLRRILFNRVLDELRSAKRRPARHEVDEDMVDPGPSPAELAMSREVQERYERALAELPEPQRRAVVLRVEHGLPFEDIARELGKPTPNAARLFVVRALERLSKSMRDLR